MVNQQDTFRIRKNTGEYVDFDIDKLKAALTRSGASGPEIEAVIKEVGSSLYDGITTHKIYSVAYKVLRKVSHRVAGRYRLKKAMLELGPTGYPFEKFVARLLHFQGFEVQTGQLVKGKCVTHEVDVVARKDGHQIMVECKYHSDNRGKSDVKVPLYIHSRFMDIEDTWRALPGNKDVHFQGMLVTNSRFTDDALEYGICSGLKLVSWDYPAGNSLRDWIDRSGFHPITSLQSLNKLEKQKLLEQGIVICQDIIQKTEVLDKVVSPNRRISQVIKEARALVS